MHNHTDATPALDHPSTERTSSSVLRPLSPWAALVMAWIRPATTARRTDHVSLARAFAVHAVLLLLLALLLVVIEAWDGSRGLPWQEGGMVGWPVPGPYVSGLAADCMSKPTDFVFSLAGIGAVVGGSGMVLALLGMPWAAREEPMVSSFRAALRRTWLGTSVLLPATLSLCPVFMIVFTYRFQWDAWGYPQWPVHPEAPANLRPNTPEFDAYVHEVEVYRQEVDRALAENRRRQPWYVRYDELLILMMLTAAGTWVLWVWLRFVSADRGLPPRDHPPLCEKCGYNLTGAELDRVCPECGVPVRESLGPNVRPGTPWERRAEFGIWAGWWRSAVGAALRPREFGRHLRARSRTLHFASFLASNLALLLLCAWGGWFACAAAMTWHGRPLVDYLDLFTSTGFLASITTMIALGLACVVAVATGLGYRLRDGSNLLPATIQAAAYLAPLLVLWTVFSGATALAVILLGSAFEDLATILGLRQYGFFATQLLQFAVWLVVNLLFLAAYVRWVVCVTAGARYANR